MSTGESLNQSPQEGGISRRDFLRTSFGLAGAAVVLGPLVACSEMMGDEEWKQYPLDELEAEYESEKQMHELLKKYEDVKEATETESLEAALLTQAVLQEGSVEGVQSTYEAFKANHAANDTEAALLTVSATLPEVGSEEVGRVFEEVRNADEVEEAEAANITTISTYTNKEVDSVLYYYGNVGEQTDEAIVPVVVMARLLQGDTEATAASLQAIQEAGITNKYDQAAALFAQTFTSVKLEDIVAIQKELAQIDEIDEGVRADLITAAVYNNLDLESTLEAYNYAGTLKGMTKEGAAKLTLALYGSDIPVLGDGEELSRRPEQRASGSGVVIVPRVGYVYGVNSYAFGTRSTTTFAPTSRGSSFSTPGRSTARGGGRGGVGGARGGGSG